MSVVRLVKNAMDEYRQLTLRIETLTDEQFLEFEVNMVSYYETRHEHSYLIGCLRHFRRMTSEA